MSAEEKFLSVIIPIHNTGPYLVRCLNYIADLPIVDVEILLIDDGSSDESGSICDNYCKRDARFQVIHQGNMGVSAARNNGLAIAKGEMVAFFDSDDYISPGDFYCVVEMLRLNPKIDFIITDFDRITESGLVRDRVSQIKETDEPVSDSFALDYFFFAGHNFWNLWRCVFRRSFLLEQGLTFDDSVSCAEDLKFMVNAFIVAKNIYLWHKPFYHYMVNYGATLSFTYSYKRVHDVVSVLRSSLELSRIDNNVAVKLTECIIKEFFLNLPLLYCVSKNERNEVRNLFKKNLDLFLYSKQKKYHLFYYILQLIGISASCWVLYIFKYLKNWYKTFKLEKLHLRGGKAFVKIS
jgi:glycosyltransferase involved in cell wall biosynthesis